MPQHIEYQNKYCRRKSSRLEYYFKYLKYYFLIKISQITPIVIAQMFLCFKMRLKACLWKRFENGVDKVSALMCKADKGLSGSCFQHLVFFSTSYQLHWNTKRKTETAYNISLKNLPWQSKHKTITILSDKFQVKCISFFVRLCLSPANPFWKI